MHKSYLHEYCRVKFGYLVFLVVHSIVTKKILNKVINAVVTILDVSKAMSLGLGLVLGLGLIWFDSCFVFVIVKNFCGRRVLKKC